MLQVTTNVAAYRPKCTCLNICKYLYFTSHQLLFYLRRNRVYGSHGAAQIIVSILEVLFPVKISEIFLKFSGIPCTFNICGVWCDPKEWIQASQSMSLMKLCMWTTCTSICTVHINFVFWGNSIAPVGNIRKRCFEKLDAVIFILLGTDDTTKLFWFLKPNDIFNYKCTAWKIHYCSYDLFSISATHTSTHLQQQRKSTTTLAFIPLMLLALICWRTHDQTVLYNWRVAKYALHEIFNRDELTRTK